MRGTPVSRLSAFALLFWLSVAAAAPAPNEAHTAVNFLLTTCEDSTDNLAAVARLAKEPNWTSMLDPGVPEKGPLKVEGIWLVSQNGQSYTVSTGIGPRGKTSCEVGFINPKPRRTDFIAVVADALTLKGLIDQSTKEFRLEMYQVVNLAPKNVVLQLASSPDGTVFEASIIGPP
jgi:hypothetical protein